jgi:hypothetical protein
MPINFILQNSTESLQMIAQVIGFIAVIGGTLGGGIFAVWWVFYGKKQKHWQDLAGAQEKKIAFMEGEIKDLKAEVAEMKTEMGKLERRAERSEEREEELRKDNLRLKAMVRE